MSQEIKNKSMGDILRDTRHNSKAQEVFLSCWQNKRLVEILLVKQDHKPVIYQSKSNQGLIMPRYYSHLPLYFTINRK